MLRRDQLGSFYPSQLAHRCTLRGSKLRDMNFVIAVSAVKNVRFLFHLY